LVISASKRSLFSPGENPLKSFSFSSHLGNVFKRNLRGFQFLLISYVENLSVEKPHRAGSPGALLATRGLATALVVLVVVAVLVVLVIFLIIIIVLHQEKNNRVSKRRRKKKKKNRSENCCAPPASSFPSFHPSQPTCVVSSSRGRQPCLLRKRGFITLEPSTDLTKMTVLFWLRHRLSTHLHRFTFSFHLRTLGPYSLRNFAAPCSAAISLPLGYRRNGNMPAQAILSSTFWP